MDNCQKLISRHYKQLIEGLRSIVIQNEIISGNCPKFDKPLFIKAKQLFMLCEMRAFTLLFLKTPLHFYKQFYFGGFP